MEIGDVESILQTDRAMGLSQEEARSRLRFFGSNRITQKAGKGPVRRFLLQFHQPLIYILLGSSAIAAALKELVDSLVILGVVLVNAVIGYLQEAKAVNALAALARSMKTTATVVRSGKKLSIDATELVPGDLVLLQAGDKVPADLRIIASKDLQVDESALTGESVPVQKDVEPQGLETVLADRRSMGYASTLVTYGQGAGIVVATGDSTEVGRISTLISTTQDLATPLTRKISAFSALLLYIILGLAMVTLIAGLLRGERLIDMFMAAVALAVGAIPEGLPAAVTVTLAIGVARMARRRAIIRRLPAVETLGSTTVICSDKTGTLTENQMTVQAVWAGGRNYQVTGVGYAPDSGSLVRRGERIRVSGEGALARCLMSGVLCNDAALLFSDGQWRVQGDPTEVALLSAAVKAGLDVDGLRKEFPRVDVIPFQSEHQFMATLHHFETGSGIFVKGSVEAVIARCDRFMGPDGGEMAMEVDDVLETVERLAQSGLRVLAFAGVDLGERVRELSMEMVESGLTFYGLEAMMDPPRQGVLEAIEECRRAGVKVKMITGDHALTGAAIAAKIGLDGAANREPREVPVVTGRALATMSDKELAEVIDETPVFARTSPDQKLRLVKALQDKGHIVAMTGDGVNDAPALKSADIGIAMGITGTEVAKEASDMVLTDDNFSTIKAAVEEGRGVFDNLIKFIVWTLPTNLGEGLVIMVSVLMGLTLPILPLQILWINMTTAGFLGLMLAFEPKEPDIMTRPPRDPTRPILTPELIFRIGLVGVLLLVGSFSLFWWELGLGSGLVHARTVAVNAFVVMELFYLFNCRSLSASAGSMGLFTNPWIYVGVGSMSVVQLAYTYLPFMNTLFKSTPIGLAAWGRVLVAGAVTFTVIEVEKACRRRGCRRQGCTGHVDF